VTAEHRRRSVGARARLGEHEHPSHHVAGAVETPTDRRDDASPAGIGHGADPSRRCRLGQPGLMGLDLDPVDVEVTVHGVIVRLLAPGDEWQR
jgi:hypothetical protein